MASIYRYYWCRHIFAFIGLLFLSITIQAQITKDTFELKLVEIKSAKPLENEALTTTHIDSLTLQTLQTKSLSELISSNSPVFIKTYGRGSAATASFRGTAASHSQVFWNGIQINSPLRGDVDFSLFPVYFIDQLDLLHGSSSLSQSSGGLGGSILIKNQADWTNRLQFKYIQEMESFETYREFFQFAIGNQKFQSKTRIFHQQSENNFDFYNTGVLPFREDIQQNANYHKYGFLQEAYLKVGLKNQVSLRVSGLHHFRNLPQLMSFEGNDRTEYQEDDEIRTQLEWGYFNGNHKWEAYAAYHYHQLHYFRSSTENAFENFNSESNESSFNSHIEYQFKTREKFSLRSSLNTALHQVDIYDKVLRSGYEESRLEFSFLAQLNYKWNSRLSSFAICRSEYFDNSFIPLIPALGVEYQLLKNSELSIFMNASRNYHKPSLNDLYWIPGGNENLKPEDGYSADLGLKFTQTTQRLKSFFSINLYSSLIENWIVWQPSSSGAYYWEAQNLKTVWARGVEAQLKLKYIFQAKLNFQLSANYAYTKTTNQNAVESVDQSRGKQLIYIPRNTANLRLDIHYGQWDLGIGNQSTGKRYTTSSNQQSDYELILTAFSITQLDLGYGFNWNKWDIRAGFKIENLFDVDYMMILWRPMPGRYYAFNLQIKWRK